VRKSAPKSKTDAASSKKSRKKSTKAGQTTFDPEDEARLDAAIRSVNNKYGEGDERVKKLAVAVLRGVTMRPSGKWQAQLYYAGKSRYIGVFDSKVIASLAYEIAREVLKIDKGQEGPTTPDETNKNIALARKAACRGVDQPL